jgi:hypothetical protein
MIEKVLIIIIIFFIIYFLNKISTEQFYVNNKNGIKIHIINTNPIINGNKIRNYLTYPYINLMLIRTLNDIFKTQNKQFNLEKIIEYDYRNNLINKYQYIPLQDSEYSKHITDVELNEFIENDIDIFNKIITYDNPPIYLETLIDNMCDEDAFNLEHTHIIVVPYIKRGIVKINNKIIIGLYKNDNKKTIPNLPSSLSYNWLNNYYNNILARDNIIEKIEKSPRSCEKIKYAPQLNNMTKFIDINSQFIKHIETIEILAHFLNTTNKGINISKTYNNEEFTSTNNIEKCDIDEINKEICKESLDYNYDSKLDNDNIEQLLQTYISNPTLDNSFKNSLTDDLNYFNPVIDTSTEELVSHMQNMDNKIDLGLDECTQDIVENNSRNAYLNSDDYYLNTFPESYI